MGNPRNAVRKNENTESSFDASNWKTMTLGSMAVKGKDGQLMREGQISFTINSRNAELIKDAAEYILSNPEDKITISAGTFFEDANISDKVKKFFSHRVYVSAETVAKLGKTIADYVK